MRDFMAGVSPRGCLDCTVGGTIPSAEDPGLLKSEESHLGTSIHAFLALYSRWWMWAAVSGYCCFGLPEVVDCNLGLGAKSVLFYQLLLVGYLFIYLFFILITAAGNETNTVSLFLSSSCCCDKYHDQRDLGEGRGYLILCFQVIIDHWGKSGQELQAGH